jgi:hypothetical protein
VVIDSSVGTKLKADTTQDWLAGGDFIKTKSKKGEGDGWEEKSNSV